jgi:hypothetical protein
LAKLLTPATHQGDEHSFHLPAFRRRLDLLFSFSPFTSKTSKAVIRVSPQKPRPAGAVFARLEHRTSRPTMEFAQKPRATALSVAKLSQIIKTYTVSYTFPMLRKVTTLKTTTYGYT